MWKGTPDVHRKHYSEGHKHVETTTQTENQNHNDGDGETCVNQSSNIEREEESESAWKEQRRRVRVAYSQSSLKQDSMQRTGESKCRVVTESQGERNMEDADCGRKQSHIEWRAKRDRQHRQQRLTKET